MASAPSKTGPRRPKPPRNVASRGRQRANTRLVYDIAGIAFVALGLLLLATLALPGSRSGENLFGRAVVGGLRLLVGDGAWFFPAVLLVLGGMLAIGRSRSWDNVGAAIGLFLTWIAWWHLGHVAPAEQFRPAVVLDYGGYVGAALSWVGRGLFGNFGAHLLFLAMTGIGLLYLTDVPLPSLLGPLERAMGRGATASGQAVATGAKRAAARVRRGEWRLPGLKGGRRLGAPPAMRVSRTPVDLDNDPETVEDEGPTAPGERGSPIPVQPPLFLLRREKRLAQEGRTETPARAESASANLASAPAPPAPAAANPAATDFVLPATSLLKASSPPADPRTNESQKNREILIQTLEDFGIGADIAEIAYGPTVTRYEIALDRGIKVSKIVSLADNLAMALAAIDVRVEAPIPGKSAIGIEVPNERPVTVGLRECLESAEFRNAPGKLTFALGKDVTGAVRVADLAKMPHLLIGGSTGSGKSIGINALISSLLYRCTPRELKLLMIDPKKVELSLYDGIPHLASPVITNVKQAPSLFKQALKEMEGRYDRFARLQTRNIEGYNAKVPDEERLPYWVIVVDELADLMMTSGPEIETSICRLAQLARATGIHLVIATQRPSVNVITGTIKANISSRIAFAVNSAVDSRTILDQVGADRLIGRGDMLFMPIDAAKPLRIQGCFVSEQETEALARYLKTQGQPHFDVLPSTLSLSSGDDDSGEAEPDDELFEAAVRLVVTGGSASTSMLQRRFKIGYTRAARLVDLMEQRGIVGPLDGARPREILMSRDEIEAMFLRADGE